MEEKIKIEVIPEEGELLQEAPEADEDRLPQEAPETDEDELVFEDLDLDDGEPAEETAAAAPAAAEETVPAEETAAAAPAAAMETAPAEELSAEDIIAAEGFHLPKWLIPSVLAAALAAAAGWYAFTAQKYRTRFFPNTTINGVDVSELTAAETEELLNEEAAKYTLKVSARNCEPEILTADQTGFRYVFDDTMDQLIGTQNPFAWAAHLSKETEYRMDTVAALDDAAFEAAVNALACMDESRAVDPTDAHLSEFEGSTGYRVISEDQGCRIDRELAESSIRSAMTGMEESIDLETIDGMYAVPSVTKDDAVLTTLCRNLNRCVRTNIRYTESNGLVLTGEMVNDWITIEGGGTVSVQDDKITAFAATVAAHYDTYNRAKPLHTSWGQDINVRGGSYGWRVDQAAEAAWLRSAIAQGLSQSRYPEFSKKAASHGAADYGDTYVEVNLTAQHLYFYKNGKVVVDSDFVSGNVSKNTPTHTGVYQVAYKQRNAVLHGENYETPVDFWMPFNGGEGLHDASWRSSFGGNIYKTSGSHGCVNLPRSVAEKIFNNISAGTPVIVYSLSGTESGGTSSGAAQETKAAQETTAAAQETSAAAQETRAAQETTAAAVKPAEAETTAGAVKPAEPETTAAPETSAARETAAMVQPLPSSGGSPSPAGGDPSGQGSGSAGPGTSGAAGPGTSGEVGPGASGPGGAAPGTAGPSSGTPSPAGPGV